MSRGPILGLVLLAAAAPLAANDVLADEDAAEERLRVCLSTGAPDAPRDSLDAAVAALRTRCYPQFTRLRDLRLRLADEKLGLPSSGLTSDQKLTRERTRIEAQRDVDAELVRAVSSATGLMKRDVASH